MASFIVHSRKRRKSDACQPSVNESGGSAAERRPKRHAALLLSGPALPSEIINAVVARRREISQLGLEEIDAQIQEAEDEAKACSGKRWLWRRAQDAGARIVQLQLERQARATGAKLAEFDASVKPVMRRLRAAMRQRREGAPRAVVDDAEREVRKRLTDPRAAVVLTHASVGDMCDDCGVSMRVIANDSLLGCPQCAKTRVIPLCSAPSGETDYVATSTYHQKSRLVEWLENCQAKEYAEPAPDVLEHILDHLVAQRATGLEDFVLEIARERAVRGPFIDARSAMERLRGAIPGLHERLTAIKPNQVRAAMQAVSTARHEERIRKFYERAPKYAAYISGFWPLRFSSVQEDRIRKLYSFAAPAYDKFRKSSQPNWPGGYAYFLRCVCVLNGWDEFAGHFNIAAGPKNTLDREAQRQKIWTEELDWEFVPSSPAVLRLPAASGAARKRGRDE
jgi:hypothetical protein